MGGVGLYGVIAITLFFLVFTGALFFAFQMKKGFLKDMSSLPLDDGSVQPDQQGDSTNER